MTTLMEASRQWSTRPDDEKYSSLEALNQAAYQLRMQAREAPEVPMESLRTQVVDGEVELTGSKNIPSKMTNWSFGQLSSRVGAPASFLRQLPATLSSEVLNNRLKARAEGNVNLLLHQNGGYMVRAFTSDKYTRIWNYDVTSRLIRLVDQAPEWQPAPAAFDGSRGLYLSDRDMFAFLVDNDRRIFEKGPGGGLGRGFFVWNSEVGSASFGVMTFYYEFICGNHRVWGAKGVQELRIRHVGNADERAFQQLTAELRRYADSSAAEDELKIESARKFKLGATKDEVLDAVFKLKIPALSRKMIGDGYDKAEFHSEWYGDPKTVWGLTGGLTEIARDIPHADRRAELDRAAGKLLQVAF